SLFNYLVDEHPEAFASVGVVFTGGEPASPTHISRLYGLCPRLRIVNGYGPAESMGFTTTYRVDQRSVPDVSVPIGRPVVNKYAYVLDERLRPVPAGVIGEVYLAGDGLAHGYLAQPGTTATRFLPHPFGSAGSRLYRTGDLAHWDRDGALHYAGRTDGQVKIRGFRIEPTEIETVLTTHPHLTQAALAVHTDVDGTPRLVAYTVAADPAGTEPQEIRRWLRERMPDHMVPAFVVPMERLPLTPNGKIDKRALPAPQAVVSTDGRAPRTPLEGTVRDAFAEALGAAGPLTIDDDFFAHGGHSLLAARLTHRLGTALGVTLTLRDVFQNPTPAALAQCIASRQASGANRPRRARPALRRRTTDQERSSS
ncbi:non-ribosomal peptide synthetase, partial [Streptomyces sp. NPDC005925]|uniref:non-ribosomal peptide synthetase n=1 Tax=Streptomyces sp. NPDC005925 TaxID=3157172 RepID=UPI0033E06C3F